MTNTMNTGAASLLPCPFCGCSASPELNGNGIGDNWLECVECGASTRLREDGAGSVKDWNRRASTPQADAAPIINGHAINDLFLKWSEWTTELGEAISRKNIDGFVSELRAAIAAGGAQEACVFEWLETELSAISCRYHGDPSYDHDAYWMRDRVMKLIDEARKIFAFANVAHGAEAVAYGEFNKARERFLSREPVAMSDSTRELARQVLERRANDTRSDEEKIQAAVNFICDTRLDDPPAQTALTDDARKRVAKAIVEVYLGFPAPDREPCGLDLKAADAAYTALTAAQSASEGNHAG